MSSPVDLLRAVRASYRRVGSPRHVLAGFSGGADSTALLLLLRALSEEAGFTLSAAHVNHGLRADADADEAFARDTCARLRVPFYARRVSVERRGSVEDAARRARYAAFDAIMAETGAEALALAQHMDDQAETVLMHLLYGSGARGMGGMRELSGRVWRPLLGARREELRAYLLAQGQGWREDESNRDTAFLRNRLRLEILPALEGISAAAVPNLCRAAAILRDEDACLARQAESWLLKNARLTPPCRFLLADAACNLDDALLRRVLRRAATLCGVPEMDLAQTERLRALLMKRAGSMENLPGGWRALRTRTRLHFLPPYPEKAEAARADWRLQTTPYAGDAGDGRLQQAFAQAALQGAELRARAPGDYIRPFGMAGKKPLKDYLIELDVDRPFRDAWPLLCRGSEVLWVIGVGASCAAKIENGQKDALLLTFSGRLPDTIEEEHK